MLLRLFLLFTIIPLAELWLLLWFSSLTSPTVTFGLVVVTGILGAWLARKQGSQAWKKIQQHMVQGQPPTGVVLDGLMILIAGAFLITPGIMTDMVGFAFLIPAFREIMKVRIGEWLKKRALMQVQTQVNSFQAGAGFQSGDTGFEDLTQPRPSVKPEDIIDVEFVRKDSPETD
ncbi:MAG: FxsA family protein [Planctomycetes bacterium]|nr:FxsA family protein [Planctomycetota bacterium]MCH9726725.1 FxsA family protein [Planctomycetota bacterium]MCH9779633.1 FxsA family protein [Planctomycetota bacterium]MCH9792199.1 FxsA family protein [Planctomycetota bacterium]